jgi:hypothetical protein
LLFIALAADDDDGDDGDQVLDVADDCEAGETGWTSDATTDLDGDGCRDATEDDDDDGDAVADNNDECPQGETGSAAFTDENGNGCRTGLEEVVAPGPHESTATMLSDFFEAYGGEQQISPNYVDTLESLLAVEDAVYAEEWATARRELDALLAQYEPGTSDWALVGAPPEGANAPLYSMMRMLQLIVETGDVPTVGTLTMRELVAECADADVVVNTDLETERRQLAINPALTADGGRQLFLASRL